MVGPGAGGRVLGGDKARAGRALLRRVLRWPVKGVLMARGRRAMMAVESWKRIVVGGVLVLFFCRGGCE